MPHHNVQRLAPGTRVRHITQQHPRALAEGTAVITSVITQHRSDGTREYRALTDSGEVRQWGFVDTIGEQ